MLNPEAPKNVSTTISRHVAVLRSLSNRLSPLAPHCSQSRAGNRFLWFVWAICSILFVWLDERERLDNPVTHVTITMMP